VFTPNGDAINDVFQFKMENIISLDLTILNRWGQTVYNSSVLNAEWNGDMSNGLPAEEGVYFYIYSAVGKQNEALSGHGFVHLVR
jgi:gliding motility-associated-like protein